MSGSVNAELRELADDTRLELKPAAERADLVREPILGEVRARPEIDDGADVELAAGHDRHVDAILDHEVAALDGERACGALRDEPAPQLARVIARQLDDLGKHLDLVAVRARGDRRVISETCVEVTRPPVRAIRTAASLASGELAPTTAPWRTRSDTACRRRSA